jgi:hypothetical protein
LLATDSAGRSLTGAGEAFQRDRGSADAATSYRPRSERSAAGLERELIDEPLRRILEDERFRHEATTMRRRPEGLSAIAQLHRAQDDALFLVEGHVGMLAPAWRHP